MNGLIAIKIAIECTNNSLPTLSTHLQRRLEIRYIIAAELEYAIKVRLNNINPLITLNCKFKSKIAFETAKLETINLKK